MGVAHRPAEIEHSEQVAPASNTKPALVSAMPKKPLDDYQIDSDYDDEPDEILTDFLE